MQKRKAALVTLILMSVFVVLSFMPIILTRTYNVFQGTGPYGVGESYKVYDSVATGIFGRNIALAILVLLLAAVSIVVFAMMYLGKENDLLKIGVYAPAASTVLFAVLSIVDVATPLELGKDYFEYWFAWGFYIECALLVAATVISIMIALGKVKDDTVETTRKVAPKKEEPKTNVSSADELKKYKELFDSGAITQEEFDDIKKRILNI